MAAPPNIFAQGPHPTVIINRIIKDLSPDFLEVIGMGLKGTFMPKGNGEYRCEITLTHINSELVCKGYMFLFTRQEQDMDEESYVKFLKTAVHKVVMQCVGELLENIIEEEQMIGARYLSGEYPIFPLSHKKQFGINQAKHIMNQYME